MFITYNLTSQFFLPRSHIITYCHKARLYGDPPLQCSKQFNNPSYKFIMIETRRKSDGGLRLQAENRQQTGSKRGAIPLLGRPVLVFEISISHTVYECLQPWPLSLALRKLPVQFGMRLAADLVNGCSIRLPFVSVIKSSNRFSLFASKFEKGIYIYIYIWISYLNPRSLYAAAAAQIICAPADFPIPWSINAGRIVTFRIFPV